jgi:hypothetical protein
VAAVETDCGSHTHTFVPTKRDCRPPHDGISVAKVPRANPEASAVVNFPVLFPDGGNPGIPAADTKASVSATTGCHDITVYRSWSVSRSVPWLTGTSRTVLDALVLPAAGGR